MKPVHWRPLAVRDVDDVAAWYAEQGGVKLELAFIESLQAATALMAAHPGIGSPRHATVLNISGLRSWPLKKFPQWIFYIEHETHLDVWRVLHSERDIPAWMEEGK